MTRKKLIIKCVAVSLMAMTCATVFPQVAMASEYISCEDMYINVGGAIKTATDKNGITWNYYVRTDGKISLEGTSNPKETMIVPAELNGYKVAKLSNLVQETDRMDPNYGVRSTIPKKVIVSEGISEIGAGGLGLNSITEVQLPSTIKIMSAHSMNLKWENEHRDSNGFVVYKGILLGASKAKGEVVIPSNIVCIGDNVFSGNSDITSVVIPKNVKRIGADSFYGCENLKKATIEEGVEVIGRNAFAKSYALKNVKIPSTIKSLGFDAFEPESATTEDVDKNNLVISDGVLFSGKDAKGDVVIPNGVTKICAKAFFNNHNITSVTMPSTVKEIEWIAFAGSSIKSVKISGNVKVIASSAFEHCKNLQQVEIGDGVQTIESFAFSECDKIKEINLPSSVTKIGVGAFRGCSGLETFNYGENIIVEYDAFIDTKFEGVVVSRGTVPEDDEDKTNNVIDADETTDTEVKVETGSQTKDETDVKPIVPKPYIVGWSMENGKWYYSKDGYERSKGWIYDNTYKSWFYLNQDGSMKTGWFYDSNYKNWYYLNQNGTMKTGWLQDSNGKWYYLYANGAMAHDTWVGKYYVNSSGAWVYTK